MPPKKSNAPNGFMLFTFEWKNKYGKKMSLKDATNEAGKIWSKMTAQQRGPYIERAKKDSLHSKTAGALACNGVPIAVIEQQRIDLERKERLMKFDIKQFVEARLNSGELEDQVYFFIMVNYFTKTFNGSTYVPAEISIAEYSLKLGVQRLYHTFVNPGFNMYGHQYDSQHLSDTTHKLPLPPNAKGERDMDQILREMLEFIRNSQTGKYPPLYTVKDSMKAVTSVLDFLQSKAIDDFEHVKDLQVYSIQHLFFVMKGATCQVGEMEKPKSEYLTDAFFQRDFFEYQPNIACPYHEELDRGNFCTQSFVTRWGFMFSDYMCLDLAIELIPGRHVPNTTCMKAIAKARNTVDDTESIATNSTNANSTFTQRIYDDQASSIAQYVASTSRGNHSKMPNMQDTFTMDDDVEPLGRPTWQRRSRNIEPVTDTSYYDIDSASNDLSSIGPRSNISAGRGRNNINRTNRTNSTTGSSTSTGRGYVFL